MRPTSIRMLNLLLPALLPSWRFFDRIGPALSVEFALVDAAGDPVVRWQVIRARPARLSSAALLGRLFWNPHWNEWLYLVSRAERLLDDPSPERAHDLWLRVADIVRAEHRSADATAGQFLRLRIVETMREEEGLRRQVVFVSDARPLNGGGRASSR